MQKTLFLFFVSVLLLKTGNAFAVEQSQLLLADPYILTEGDYYYAYGTSSDNGIVYYYSTDLVNWIYGGLALSKNNTNETRWFWAPEVYKFGEQYYMYYSANSHLYVAVSDSPAGPFYQTGTYLLASVIGSEECIDGSMFKDDDGTLWFYFVRWASDGERIYTIKMSDPLTPVKNTMRECMHVDCDWERIWPQVVEGPFVIKNEGKYYLSYSANSYESHDYAIGYATATAPNASWTKYDGNPILRRWKGLLGVGHHSLFRDKEGKLRIVYHAHYSDTSIHPRLTYIGSVEFVDGVMRIVDEDVISPKATNPYGLNDWIEQYSVDWSVPYVASARSNENYPILYTKNKPRGNKWIEPDFDDSSWIAGMGPIGSSDAVAPEGTAPLGTAFDDVNGGAYSVWFRRHFNLTESLADREVYLACGHDDEGSIYLDGTLLISWCNQWNSGHYFKLTPEQRSLLTKGDHVFAVLAKNNAGGYYFDCGLYGREGDQILAIVPIGGCENNFFQGAYTLQGIKCQNLHAGINIVNTLNGPRKVLHR